MKKSLISVLFAAALALPLAHAGAKNTGIPKVLVIGIDGCRVDCLTKKNTPALAELAANGRFASNAYAGGVLGTPTQQATWSGPGWATILTGVWTDKHNVKDNGFKNAAMSKTGYPHFFFRLKTEKPGLHLASVAGWGSIETQIVKPVADAFDFHFKGDGSGDHEEGGDAQVQDKLKARLTGENDDLVFVHYDQVDGAGHKYGFGPKTPQYLAALASVDGLVGEDLAVIRSRKTYENERWLVIVTTDHGGEGHNHGSQSELCRTIFIIANGPGVVPAKITLPASQADIAPTVAEWMGVFPKPEWGWAGKSFLK